MANNTPYLKIIGGVTLAVFFAIVGAFWFVSSSGLVQMAGFGGQVMVDDQGVPVPTTYQPFVLSTVTFTVLNDLDRDAAFGANDVYARAYNVGQFDWTGSYIDIQTTYSTTTGDISFSNSKLRTGQTYEILLYEGDGGTNLYANKFTVTLPALTGDKTTWSDPTIRYMITEGAFSAAAFDSSTAAFDEGATTAGEVTLNKTAQTVQGCLSWDFTVGNSVSGSKLIDPVIVIEEDASDPLTDINDIENIYLSVKTGSGFSFTSDDLVTEFRGGVPISMVNGLNKNYLGSADSGTGTLKICLPASESDVGTGSIKVHFDDLGDYRARDLDNDVRAASDSTTFKITT